MRSQASPDLMLTNPLCCGYGQQMHFIRLKRREFIALLGGAAAWPMAARAQHQGMPSIGFLNPTSPDASADRLRGFRQGLKETGFVESENGTVIYRWGEGQFDRLTALTTELLDRWVAVIATIGNEAALAAAAVTKTTPIVFLATENPVKLGLVAGLSRPNGNATGVNLFSGEVTAKRLELLRELVPAATRVAVLVNPANARTTESTLKDATTAAGAMGLQIQVLNAGTSREINAAFDTFARERPDRKDAPPHSAAIAARHSDEVIDNAARVRHSARPRGGVVVSGARAGEPSELMCRRQNRSNIRESDSLQLALIVQVKITPKSFKHTAARASSWTKGAPLHQCRRAP